MSGVHLGNPLGLLLRSASAVREARRGHVNLGVSESIWFLPLESKQKIQKRQETWFHRVCWAKPILLSVLEGLGMSVFSRH